MLRVYFRIQIERANDMTFSSLRPGDGPRGDIVFGCLNAREHDILFQLAAEGVSCDTNRVPILERKIERDLGKARHLLNRVRRQHNQTVAAMATSFGHLEIVALLRCDVAQPGTSPCDIHDEKRQLHSGCIREPLLFQAKSGAGSSRHSSESAGGCAQYHVYRLNLAGGLKEHFEVRVLLVSKLFGQSLWDFA